ncbi:MAG: hypothetical protein Q9220_007658 [cf. Caloplaca sp. 1 TL-2023]
MTLGLKDGDITCEPDRKERTPRSTLPVISQISLSNSEEMDIINQAVLADLDTDLNTASNRKKSLTKECLSHLAQLSEHVTLQAGRELLLQQIRTRTLSKSQGLKVTDSHLKPRDVVNTLRALGPKHNADDKATLKSVRDGWNTTTISKADYMDLVHGRNDLGISQSCKSSHSNDASASTPLEPNALIAPEPTRNPQRKVLRKKRKMSGEVSYSQPNRPKKTQNNTPMEALEYDDEDSTSPETRRFILPQADNPDEALESSPAGSSTRTTTPYTPAQNSPAPHTYARKLSSTALLQPFAPEKLKKRRCCRNPTPDLEFIDEEGGDDSQASLRYVACHRV